MRLDEVRQNDNQRRQHALEGSAMPKYLALSTIVLLGGMVLTRILLLGRTGTRAVHFGRIDRTDFLIPPFALLYCYLVFAATFHLPTISRQRFFDSEFMAWVGVSLCCAGLTLLLLSLVSFGKSFRVGIDTTHPGALVTNGIYAVSRNPIYVAFGLVLLGQFLVFPNWVMLGYVAAGCWLLHRQVLREEDFLSNQYGQEFAEYCHRVRRYL